MQTFDSSVATRAWWLAQEVPDNHRLVYELGPFALELHRSSDEWRVAWRHDPAEDQSANLRIGVAEGALDVVLERYVHAAPVGRARLRPLLMDRNVVIRPREPVFLPSGQETTLYLSTPVCASIEVGEPPLKLREVPMLPLSDTWFGPSTREGELCYSGRTHARHHIAELPRRPHRAITPLHIRNHATSVLPIEKLSLPVPTLSVFGADDGSLWTQGVSLTRASDSDLATLRIEPGPPRYARGATPISEPRRPAERNGLVRAFSLLFGH
jgi:hypothetical protein